MSLLVHAANVVALLRYLGTACGRFNGSFFAAGLTSPDAITFGGTQHLASALAASTFAAALREHSIAAGRAALGEGAVPRLLELEPDDAAVVPPPPLKKQKKAGAAWRDTLVPLRARWEAPAVGGLPVVMCVRHGDDVVCHVYPENRALEAALEAFVSEGGQERSF